MFHIAQMILSVFFSVSLFSFKQYDLSAMLTKYQLFLPRDCALVSVRRLILYYFFLVPTHALPEREYFEEYLLGIV